MVASAPRVISTAASERRGVADRLAASREITPRRIRGLTFARKQMWLGARENPQRTPSSDASRLARGTRCVLPRWSGSSWASPTARGRDIVLEPAAGCGRPPGSSCAGAIRLGGKNDRAFAAGRESPEIDSGHVQKNRPGGAAPSRTPASVPRRKNAQRLRTPMRQSESGFRGQVS
jgi:hypothetical protein